MSSSIRKLPQSVLRPIWHHVDAKGLTVGRLATQIATVLMGKHKPIFDNSMNCGDFVVVTNADKVEFSGKKEEDKIYRWHSGYPGGLKEVSPEKLREKKPCDVLVRAVSGMLPKNKLRRERLRMLRVFEGPEHEHDAQKPVPFNLQFPAKRVS
ncbi:mitochondrial ribosomal protein L13 (uL13m) [Andalucia godoyi]|uniref:Mitochondrial ribosomal protein L13 (UL13m) n=1 Tax=Andalucia godoyi TaxID=505711 RepID=A0A8K0AK41_ANDGO|nr:mitochondrial ribosomal protein L13 (uL13m) [Andalucia godoyi]|eukprot:ANDGO_04842.mRNA.1 mitochondrial ribosomal protein L13 (uL13m)